MNALVAQVWDFLPRVRQFAIRSCLCCVTSSCCCVGRGHTHTQGGAASWDSGGSEKISPPGLRCCKPSGFRGNAWVCEFQSTQDGVNTCVVSPSGFGSAAGFTVFKLWVQEETKLSALKACPCSVTKSFLHINNVIVRHKDTYRTRV